MKNIDFKVYNVTHRVDKDDFWNSLGGAFKFKTQDGRNGINIPSLNLVLLEPKAENETSSQSA